MLAYAGGKNCVETRTDKYITDPTWKALEER
jgi:hypothetical protein